MVNGHVGGWHFGCSSGLCFLHGAFVETVSLTVLEISVLNVYFSLFSSETSLFFLEAVLVLLHLLLDILCADLFLWTHKRAIRLPILIMNFWFLIGLYYLVQTVPTESIHKHVLLLSLLIVCNLIVNSFYRNLFRIVLSPTLLLSLLSCIFILLLQKFLPKALVLLRYVHVLMEDGWVWISLRPSSIYLRSIFRSSLIDLSRFL